MHVVTTKKIGKISVLPNRVEYCVIFKGYT